MSEWSKYEKLVVNKLFSLETKTDHLIEKLQNVEKQIVVLKLKSGIWGLLGGFIPIVILIIIQLLIKK